MEQGARVNGESFAVSSFDDLPGLQNHDVVASFDGEQVMGNDHDDPTRHQPFQRVLDQSLGAPV